MTVEGVTLHDAGDFVLLQRHGFDRYVRAHEIDHVANVRALATSSAVDTAVVAGRVLMRHRRVDDEDEVRAPEASRRICG